MGKKLTQAEFEAVDDGLSAALRATRPGTPERTAVEARRAIWEAAIALPDRTWAQREERLAAIAEAAAKIAAVQS